MKLHELKAAEGSRRVRVWVVVLQLVTVKLVAVVKKVKKHVQVVK